MAKTWSYATRDDLPGLVDLMYAAFASPECYEIFHDDEGGRAFIRAMYEAAICPPPPGQPWQQRKVVVIRDDDGKVLSSVIYYIVRPEDKGLWPWSKRFPEPTPDMGLDKKVLDEFYTGALVQSAKYVGEQPHIYVNSAVTLPSHQRKGYMSTLLDVGNQLADELDYPLFLMATVTGMSGYLKKGYGPLGTGGAMLRKKKSERI
ncbi:hypothetical protein GQ53DRAFT_810482 [Thozetella sp. PMI_491]|nr:hypothetical protein GQ53DRAFT_810482 [Thozetella sp. PMI_491]